MSGYPAGFPLPVSWDDDALLLLPSIAATPPGDSYWLGLVSPMQATLDRYALLYAGQADIGDAAGFGLDLAGDLVGEARGGLLDDEYRRIISGRRIATGGRVSQQRAAAGWRALTDDAEATVKSPGLYSLHMRASVTDSPSGAFLIRAANVVKGLVPTAYDIEAVMYRSDSALYDAATYGYDVGRYAWALRTRRTT
jgi:hypothetical protein